MKIAVFGAGGVGGYFGGRLAQGGNEVIYIARNQHLQAIRTGGLQILSPSGNYTHHPAAATDNPSTIGVVDVVLLGVKAWQVPEAAQAIRPLIGPATLVLPLQNGIEAVNQLIAALGQRPVSGGTCRIIARIAAPGIIEHAGIEPYIAFAELNGKKTERVRRLAAAFAEAGVRVDVPNDILSVIWQKFIFIAAISGVGAVTRAPFGLIRTTPQSRAMYVQAAGEIIAIAAARSILIPPDYIATLERTLDDLPADGTASMQRDIISGNPSELEAQNGAVVRLAEALRLDAPVNRFIYHALLPQERKARGEA